MCKYTSVFPDPVTPKRTNGEKPEESLTARDAAYCSAFSLGVGRPSVFIGGISRIRFNEACRRARGGSLKKRGKEESAASPHVRM